MITGVHVEVMLASGYAIFLACVAFALELLARCSHRRSEGYRTSGFTYSRDFDQWECPAGRQLVQVNKDLQRGIVRYQADAKGCNSCSLKLNCTDSNEGRVLETRLAPWFESELRRFHRGLSMALLFLATLLLLAEFIRHSGPQDRLTLVALLLPLGFVQLKLLPSLTPGHRTQHL